MFIVLHQTAHDCRDQTIHSSPAVRKHFNSYLLSNELVSVSHLEAKSLSQATQSAGAVAPGHSYTKMVNLQLINNAVFLPFKTSNILFNCRAVRSTLICSPFCALTTTLTTIYTVYVDNRPVCEKSLLSMQFHLGCTQQTRLPHSQVIFTNIDPMFSLNNYYPKMI